MSGDKRDYFLVLALSVGKGLSNLGEICDDDVDEMVIKAKAFVAAYEAITEEIELRGGIAGTDEQVTAITGKVEKIFEDAGIKMSYKLLMEGNDDE